jgi:hypothetical protein
MDRVIEAFWEDPKVRIQGSEPLFDSFIISKVELGNELKNGSSLHDGKMLTAGCLNTKKELPRPVRGEALSQ